MIGESPSLVVQEDRNGRTVIRGYAALFRSMSQDLGGYYEDIEPGAFDEVMRKNPDVFGRFNHDRLLGRTSSGTMRLMIDERGLLYEIDPPASAADVVELISRNDVRGSSFAFRTSGTNEKWWKDEQGRTRRTILRFDGLYDAGPVEQPAYLGTETYVSKRALDQARAMDVPPQVFSVGDFVAWDGGVGMVVVVGDVPGVMEGTAENPVAMVSKYEFESDENYWEECDEFVFKRMTELVAASGITGEAPAMLDSQRSINLKPTAGMAAAAKRGLRLHEEGKSGDGLKPETVARANKLARREEMNEDWVREMNAWFARHASDKRPGWDTPGSESPGFTAYLMWGGTPAKNWSARKVAEMDRAKEAARSSPPVDYDGKIAQLKAMLLVR